MRTESESFLSSLARPATDQPREESEFSKNPEINSSSLPPEPYVIVKNGGEKVEKLTLREAVEKIASSEEKLLEKRRKDLARRLRETLSRRSHGKPRGHGRKTSKTREIRRFYEKEMRKRLSAREYPLIDLILRSPQDEPFEISPGVSPLSDSFPSEGEMNPFYHLICEELPSKVLRLLEDRKSLKSVYQFFLIRSTVFWEYKDREIKKWGDAIDKINELTRDLEVPKECLYWFRKITERYEIHKEDESNHFRS